MVTSDNIVQFRLDLEEALGDIETKYGVRFRYGNIHYGNARLTMQLEAINYKDGQPVFDRNMEAKAHNFFIDLGLKPPKQIINAEIIMKDGQHGVIKEFFPRRKSYPFMAVISGRYYEVALGDIKEFLPPSDAGKR